jgi:ATP synthase F1 delta subunit
MLSINQFAQARPYAKAIHKLAANQHNYADWQVFLQKARYLIQCLEQAQLLAQTAKPQLLIQEVLTQLSLAFTKEQQRCLLLLAERKQLRLLPYIQQLYDAYTEQSQQINKIVLTTKQALPAATQKQLSQLLQTYFQKHHPHYTIQIVFTTNPAMLGGWTIRDGDMIYDMSHKAQLTALYRNLTYRGARSHA